MLDRGSLMQAARDATGLSDFGPEDFEEGFAVLLESYAKDANLTDLGRQLAHDEIVGDLVGRLQVVEQLKQRPEILDTELERPIFILGLPRTGTTTIHHLLQQDPDSQVLEYWLGVVPKSRPPKASWADDADYQRVAEVLRLTYEADPGLRALHDVSAEGAGECRFVFRHLFKDDSYDHTAYLPSYRAWFDKQPMDDVYRWYHDVLKLIQHPDSKGQRWVLKYPPHLRCLKELFREFPEACVIHTHRDPAKVIPSFASLLTHFTAVYEKNVDPHQVGALAARLWEERIAQGMRDRAELDRESQFVDLHFRDVLADPVGQLRKAFGALGLPLSENAIEQMSAWQNQHQPERFGSHDYTAETYGLDPAQLSDAFSEYRAHFDIPSE
ncbi:MAG: sulfotransferase [Myxococcota bacterium]